MQVLCLPSICYMIAIVYVGKMYSKKQFSDNSSNNYI